MILCDKEKEQLKLDGTEAQLLAELSVIIEELREDIKDDKIIFAVKLGFCGGDLEKMLDLAKETILNNRKKENKNNENTKENIL